MLGILISVLHFPLIFFSRFVVTAADADTFKIVGFNFFLTRWGVSRFYNEIKNNPPDGHYIFMFEVKRLFSLNIKSPKMLQDLRDDKITLKELDKEDV